MATRPKFDHAWNTFAQVNKPVRMVGELIGGKVKFNTESLIFRNACPIRMSYVLNRSGIRIPSNAAGFAASSGADGQWYMHRVNDMIRFLEHTFGKADIEISGAPTPAQLTGKKGLLVVKGHGWDNAAGHITLWNGSQCADSCHLHADPDNGTFVPERAYLWELK
ncbi:hypothetical protein CAP48_18830 [Advenella sp. S44]|uniref:type VI secretion system amidase effector protein Tae4 n=1 Tax=Advenella sp. S44 TaxID=1982755 RepID=UPI000C29F606|nr:type VI secretion system amidase effector protein Tae4 [Advenella sp. S44]PJX20457.1 hypothetical protein CAP48_18830 [Advenella sp. S44]